MFDFFGGGSSLKPASLWRIERKLDLILEHLGIEYVEDQSDVPEPVRVRADAGDKIGAIKVYRELTGAGLADAKRFVEEYLSRRGC